MKATATLDTSQFDSKMKDLNRELYGEIIGRVLVQTLFGLKADTEKSYPKAPHLEGHLRQDVEIKLVSNEEAMIHYRVPYAARWHEAVNPEPHWSESDVGPKWVEARFLNGEKWGKLAAEILKDEIGAA